MGDVHGHFQAFDALISKHKGDIVQVGDMGLGFNNYGPYEWDERVAFIRGNHDNPVLARESKNYLGEFGFDNRLGLFFVSGAWSIDKNLRVPGVSWWEEEELSIRQGLRCLDLWKNLKPKIVVTHDGPKHFVERIFARLLISSDKAVIPNRTSQLLTEMFYAHKPKLWVIGHYHISFSEEICGTRFTCLPELGVLSEKT